MKIFIGIVLATAGVLVAVYNEKMLSTFGRVESAEKYLSSEGGSRLFYVLFGTLLVFVGLTLIFNLYDNLMMFILSPLLPRK